MTDTRADYVRTDELDGTLVPLETMRTYYDVSRKTLERWLAADGIETHQLPTENGAGRERGVRLTDVTQLKPHPTRWHRRGE